MTQPYQLITNSTAVLRRADNATIPDDPANRDRAEYNSWIAAGNTPDPPDPPPEPLPPAPLELEAHPESAMDAATKGYVDTEVAKMAVEITPLTERIEALEARLISVEHREAAP
jgi:hypothetical protein